MQAETFKQPNGTYLVRVTKTKARQLFKDGVKISIIAGGLRFNHPLACFIELDNSEDFEGQINAYNYYNNELTKRYGIKYFIEKSSPNIFLFKNKALSSLYK